MLSYFFTRDRIYQLLKSRNTHTMDSSPLSTEVCRADVRSSGGRNIRRLKK